MPGDPLRAVSDRQGPLPLGECDSVPASLRALCCDPVYRRVDVPAVV